MLTNSTILRIDKYAGEDSAGRPTYANGAACVIRCAVAKQGGIFKDEAQNRQLTSADLGRLYVETWRLASPTTIERGDRLTLQPDGRAARTYVVNYTWDRLGSKGLGHLEVDLRDE